MPTFGAYKTGRMIGRGPFYSIYEAALGDHSVPRFVVKAFEPWTITRELLASERSAADLDLLDAAEVQKIARGSIEYWGPIHAYGHTDAGNGYYVTDLADKSCKTIIEQKMTLEPMQILAIMEACVDGLWVLSLTHRRAHGNLKPANVLLWWDKSVPVVRLVDPLPSRKLTSSAAIEDKRSAGQLLRQAATVTGCILCNLCNLTGPPNRKPDGRSIHIQVAKYQNVEGDRCRQRHERRSGQEQCRGLSVNLPQHTSSSIVDLQEQPHHRWANSDSTTGNCV